MEILYALLSFSVKGNILILLVPDPAKKTPLTSLANLSASIFAYSFVLVLYISAVLLSATIKIIKKTISITARIIINSTDIWDLFRTLNLFVFTMALKNTIKISYKPSH